MPRKIHQETLTVVFGLSAPRRLEISLPESGFLTPTSITLGSQTYYLPYETITLPEEGITLVQRHTSRGLVTQRLAAVPKTWEISGTIRARNREQAALSAVQRMQRRGQEALLEDYRYEGDTYISESIVPVIVRSVAVSEPVESLAGSAVVLQYTISLDEMGEA